MVRLKKTESLPSFLANYCFQRVVLLKLVDDYNKKRLSNLLIFSRLNTIDNQLNVDGNYYCYPRKPKMSDCGVIALSILCETIGIDSENYLFGKLKFAHREDFETAPDKGYSAVSKSWYFGYKLHLATSVRGMFSSMELTRASVHDIQYLNEVKHSGITDCTLIADKAYISEPIQFDLFTTRQIRLETPMRSNQHDKEPFPNDVTVYQFRK